jgi:hypothetical protein
MRRVTVGDLKLIHGTLKGIPTPLKRNSDKRKPVMSFEVLNKGIP